MFFNKIGSITSNHIEEMSDSHWVVYAESDCFIVALPQDMKYPRGRFRQCGSYRMPNLTKVNVEEKMKKLMQEGSVVLIESSLRFQVVEDPSSKDRNIHCDFYGSGIQAGTIAEITNALLDIQSFQSSKVARDSDPAEQSLLSRANNLNPYPNSSMTDFF